MTVPNAITRVINKNGDIVPFDLSRIHKSISNAIQDIEHTSSWEAKERGLKYAELVKNRLHRNFYNLKHLVSFFSRMINTFGPNEVEERLKRAEFGRRVTTLLYMSYLSDMKLKSITESGRDQVFQFVKGYFQAEIKDEKILNITADAFRDKIYSKAREGITDIDQFPGREFIQDTIEEVLKEIGEIVTAEGFMVYRQGRLKVNAGEINESQFTHDGVHRDRLRETSLWNIENECDSVFNVNDWVTGRNGKDFKELMKRSDDRFYSDIKAVAEKIIARGNEIKVIIIAGPSCSNKTTTTTVFEQELSKNGLHLKQLNIDDYFLDLSEHPKDEFGDYDYEMPEAIDIKLLNENLRDLMNGKSIKRPIYNFKTGLRDGWKDFALKDNEIILIDCLHGLYSPLTEAIPSNKKFKIYTESSNVLRNIDGSYTKWTDVRLAKRMVRDSLYRNHPIDKTLGHWAYVRKGELKHIIPYIFTVDAVLNAGLPYELPILKAILKNKLPTKETVHKLKEDGRLDAYIRGVRLLTLFDTIVSYDKIDDVSPYSPIREFIGGSAYKLAHNE